MYTTNDIKIVGKSYHTKDDEYKTKVSTSWFYDDHGTRVYYNVGYSYWYNGNIRLGHTSYDYLFFNGKEGIDDVVKLLNKLI